MRDRKGPANIFLSLGFRKLSLGGRGANPPKAPKIQGKGTFSAHFPGQEQRLIVPALSQTARMERNRDNQIILAKRKIRVGKICQEAAQRLGQAGSSSIFKSGDPFRQEAFINRQGPRDMKMARSQKTIRTQVILSRFGYKTFAAPGAAGRGDPSDLAEAGGTEIVRVVLLLVFPAKGAPGRKKEVNQSTPKWAHPQRFRG